MTIHRFAFYALLAAGISAAQETRAVILTSAPPPGAQQQIPRDVESRVALLRVYLDTAPVPPGDDPVRRITRLDQILYLIDQHPEAEACGMPLAYVARSNGPYANEADHNAARNHWLATVDAHPTDAKVIDNAFRFLAVEDKDDAESMLKRGVATNPDNRSIAADLGFLYAMEILGGDLRAHAEAELDITSNPFVLAAAGTAIPNMAVKASLDRPIDEKLFDYANTLQAKARQLAPQDKDINGPMPMIEYFENAPQVASTPSIKVAANVQASRLVRKTNPTRPADTQLSGDVRFGALIARDGTILSVSLISGNPLLVQPAMDAVKTWVYQPTLLNGAPVEVTTEITVKFP